MIKSLYPLYIMVKGVNMNRRGISPVIATIIIVAVTLTIAIAIAYWMGGITSLYTRFEKIEVIYGNVQWNSIGKYWILTFKVKNTGSADTTIDNILLNGIPIADVTNGTYYAQFSYGTTEPNAPQLSNSSSGSISISVSSGSTVYIKISLPNNAKMGNGIATSGLSLEIKLHTTAGKEYPQMVTLP